MYIEIYRIILTQDLSFEWIDQFLTVSDIPPRADNASIIRPNAKRKLSSTPSTPSRFIIVTIGIFATKAFGKCGIFHNDICLNYEAMWKYSFCSCYRGKGVELVFFTSNLSIAPARRKEKWAKQPCRKQTNIILKN